MNKNLVSEMIKKGYQKEDIPKIIAKLLNLTENVTRNKISRKSDFTFTEALKINELIFDNKIDLKYLFKHNN